MGSFQDDRIPSVTHRWFCSTADESSCCSHETLVHDATCESKLRDAVNYKLNSEVGKHFSLRLQAVRSLLTFRRHLRDFSCSVNFATVHHMHRDLLDRFLRTDEIDASTKHHPTTFITTCHQGPNCTLSCGATMVPAQDTRFVSRLDSPVLTFLETRIFPERTCCCTHRSPTDKCRTFPNPSRWTIPFAAVASDLIATWPHKQKSFKIDCSPTPSVAALTTAANSDSPLLKAKTPIVFDHAFTN